MTKYNTELVNQMRANGPPMTRDSNDDLYTLVSTGDPVASRKMVEGNMALVISKVDSYIGQYQFASHLRDDLVSEGFVGLCIAVEKMSKDPPPERPNPTGYISYWIQHSIGAIIDKESGLGASIRTKKRKRAEGGEVPAQVYVYDTAPVPEKVVDPTSMIDLLDLLDACCDCEQDRTILHMRGQGYVDKEIALAIDAPITTTFMRRRELYARFLERSGLKGEV